MGDSPCSSRSGSPCLANGRESLASSPVSRRPGRAPASSPSQASARRNRQTAPGSSASLGEREKAAKQLKQSHEASPVVGPSDALKMPPDLGLPASIGAPGRLPVPAEVPERPPDFRTSQLVSSKSGIGADEAYSKDEEALNTFLKLHPMLSLEATSQRTLQLLSGMFEKVAIKVPDLPVVPKSFDDKFLSPANKDIGERPCVNGEKCLAQFIAKMRYGPDTPLAFTCKEFLLPDQHAQFLKGQGLPQRRAKCLLCARYFQSYVYLLARTDPGFRVGAAASGGMQVFSNPVLSMYEPQGASDSPVDGEGPLGVCDATENAEGPTHSSAVSSVDGYKPSAMLFVDEEWMQHQAPRESPIGQLMFKPVVRFCSTHYKYVKDENGLRIVQVGIGARDDSDGLLFREPPVHRAVAPAANREAGRP